MEDTPQEIKRLVRNIVMSKSEEDRFLMCAQMFEDAKEMAKIDMPEGLSADEQKAYVFRRMYGRNCPRERYHD